MRVDARTALAPDYVERCVEALERSGAAIVGGQMRYEAEDARQRGIVAAMTSRLGAGSGGLPTRGRPAALCRHGLSRRLPGDHDPWRWAATTNGRAATRTPSWPGGPRASAGSTWTRRSSPSISAATASGRSARQFYRYGHNRARTIRKHPASLSYRQLAVPALFVGLASPWRGRCSRPTARPCSGEALLELASDPPAVPTLLAAFPTMHAAWGLGFSRGIVKHVGQEETS